MSPHECCLLAPLGLETSQVLLDTGDHVGSEEGEQHLPHLLDVLQDQVGVEPLEHDVGLVGGVGQELPGGDLGPLVTDWTYAVSAEGTDTGLEYKEYINQFLQL